MATETLAPQTATKISFEEFLKKYSDGSHVEWVDGEVIPMTAVTVQHADLNGFLYALLRHFAGHHQLGRVFSDPFVMKPGLDSPGRAPDILFLSHAHLARLRRAHLEGPADLVVEIVSPDDPGRDYVDKFREYEAAGVPEYWIIDPLAQRTEFNQLRDGKYREVLPDENGVYHSVQLPGFWLRVEWLWQEPLPDLISILREWKLI